MTEDFRSKIRDCAAGRSPWPLFAHGPAGCGKTCAALCLLDHAGGLYFTAASLSQAVSDAMFGRLLSPREKREVSATQLWSEVATTPLVVLDEIGGRGSVSDHHYDCVKRLLDEREGRPTLCLSNLSLGELAKLYDDRVASRLAAGTVVVLQGVDRRLSR